MTLISKASHASINTYFYFHNQLCAIKGTGSVSAGALEPVTGELGAPGTLSTCSEPAQRSCPGAATWHGGQNTLRTRESTAPCTSSSATLDYLGTQRNLCLEEACPPAPHRAGLRQAAAPTAMTDTWRATLLHKGSIPTHPYPASPQKIWYVNYISPLL